MTRQRLLPNVYFTYLPSEKFKTGCLSAQLVTPLRRETAGLNALLVNVLSRGTAEYPDMAALSRRLDMLYGAGLEPTVRKRGEAQLFGFVASFVDERFLPEGERLLEPVADLLGELFCHPATRNGRLDWDYVRSERENLADFIRADVNDKDSYAALRLIEEMCAGEPYGVRRMGRAEDVEKISPQRLDRHYRRVLGEARLELFYCGSARYERVRGALERAFAALPRKGPEAEIPTVFREAPAEPRTVVEERDVGQGKLCVGFRSGSRDAPALRLVNALFGGTDNSKLFRNVRERLSLCYYADSTYHRRKGLITAAAGIGPEQFQPALDEIMAQLEAVRRGDWEDWELESARNILRNSLRVMEDSARAMEDFCLGQAAVGGHETPAEIARSLEAVTKERIMDAAASVRPDTVYFLRGRGEDR